MRDSPCPPLGPITDVPLTGIDLTHAIARSLTDAGADSPTPFTPAVREAADHADHVTSDQFKAGFANLRGADRHSDRQRRDPADTGA